MRQNGFGNNNCFYHALWKWRECICTRFMCLIPKVKMTWIDFCSNGKTNSLRNGLNESTWISYPNCQELTYFISPDHNHFHHGNAKLFVSVMLHAMMSVNDWVSLISSVSCSFQSRWGTDFEMFWTSQIVIIALPNIVGIRDQGSNFQMVMYIFFSIW